MSISSIPSPKTTLFFYDCEVDHKDIDTVNITEICASQDNSQLETKSDVKPYFVGYVKKTDHANYAGPYQKAIGQGERYDFSMIAKKVASFVSKNTAEGSISALMGYNVEGWDAPVLEKNMERFPHPDSVVDKRTKESIRAWKWIDLAKIAHFLGYPMGTTQQQLEVAVCAKHLPFNRHRAHADVKVAKEIWRKFTENLKTEEQKIKINEALAGENAEESVAALLKEYDPGLEATPEAIEVIQNTKKAEKLARKEIVVLYDLETTGLFPEMNKATAAPHNMAPRIVEFAAKILTPFKEEKYRNETFSSFVKVDSIPENATKVHGITTEMVQAEGRSMKDVWTDFEVWVRTTETFKRIVAEGLEESLEPKIILVGYNNSAYDNPLLTGELLHCSVDLKRELDKGVKASWDALTLMSTWYTGAPKDAKPKDNKLQTHAEFLEIKSDQAHRALSDVNTVEAILRKIMRTSLSEIEPADVIVEVVKQNLHLTSPGVATKEIARDALLAIKAILKSAPDQVITEDLERQEIRNSIERYLVRKKEESELEPKEPPRKRVKKEEQKQQEPPTQNLLVVSQSSDWQTYI